jgi:hypothetical protein
MTPLPAAIARLKAGEYFKFALAFLILRLERSNA